MSITHLSIRELTLNLDACHLWPLDSRHVQGPLSVVLQNAELAASSRRCELCYSFSLVPRLFTDKDFTDPQAWGICPNCGHCTRVS